MATNFCLMGAMEDAARFCLSLTACRPQLFRAKDGRHGEHGAGVAQFFWITGLEGRGSCSPVATEAV
jgi:hypothetical protein